MSLTEINNEWIASELIFRAESSTNSDDCVACYLLLGKEIER